MIGTTRSRVRRVEARPRGQASVDNQQFHRIGGDATQSVMKNCASDPTKFFELKKANDLVATFDSIGTALSNLRIAQ